MLEGSTGDSPRLPTTTENEMPTNLKIRRNHSESGSITGTFGKRTVDYSWNSHELWINGRCNPEDHPFETIAHELFDACEEQIKQDFPLREDQDIHEVPFEATIGTGRVVENLQVVARLTREAAGKKLSELADDVAIDIAWPRVIEPSANTPLVTGVQAFRVGGVWLVVEVE